MGLRTRNLIAKSDTQKPIFILQFSLTKIEKSVSQYKFELYFQFALIVTNFFLAIFSAVFTSVFTAVFGESRPVSLYARKLHLCCANYHYEQESLDSTPVNALQAPAFGVRAIRVATSLPPFRSFLLLCFGAAY